MSVLAEMIATFPLDTHSHHVAGHLAFMVRRNLHRRHRRCRVSTVSIDDDAVAAVVDINHGRSLDARTAADRVADIVAGGRAVGSSTTTRPACCCSSQRVTRSPSSPATPAVIAAGWVPASPRPPQQPARSPSPHEPSIPCRCIVSTSYASPPPRSTGAAPAVGSGPLTATTGEPAGYRSSGPLHGRCGRRSRTSSPARRRGRSPPSLGAVSQRALGLGRVARANRALTRLERFHIADQRGDVWDIPMVCPPVNEHHLVDLVDDAIRFHHDRIDTLDDIDRDTLEWLFPDTATAHREYRSTP